MPTLRRSAEDGHFYIQHFYRSHSTWQLSGQGAQFLSFLGVRLGSEFDTSVFMVLYRAGLVSTAANRGGRARGDLGDELPTALRAQLTRFHSAARRGADACECFYARPAVAARATEMSAMLGAPGASFIVRFGLHFAAEHEGRVLESASVAVAIKLSRQQLSFRELWVNEQEWLLLDVARWCS